MTYQVLARKWRPQDFESLVGQRPVVTSLRNALREGRIAQAYLFSGIRGVGKTTAARVFAKALNCERGAENGPCNQCTTCRDITAGSDLDVLEIDAATYSKVEQVRELTESLKYGPTRDRFKVVVLDEVHRLSRQAFDALLKIVEEPPPRLVFIFATTEIDAVPATILSRCQEYHFRRVPVAEVAAHLAAIATAEGITASEAALALVARAGEGSVRDSVALLDQLATFGGGRIAEDEAARLLGGLDLALFQHLLEAILAGDSGRIVELAREVEENGWDPRQVAAHFLAYCRDALHLALAPPDAHLALPQEEAASLARIARGAGYENLLRLLHQLLASEPAVRRSESASLALEIAWLRAAELPKLTRIEHLLAGGDAPAAPPPLAAVAPRPATAVERRIAPPGPARAEPAPPTPPEPPAPAPAAVTGDVSGFLDEVGRRRQLVAAQLDGASSIRRDGDRLIITLAADAELAATQLARESNRKILEEAARAAFGPAARVEVERAKGTAVAASAAAPSAAAVEPRAAELAAHPVVQTMLDIFGGSVARVEPPRAVDPAAPLDPLGED
jgi:DNA polymerase-3 subunit gamma/tau